ncbi:PREDICTED: nucleolar protein 12-like [Polistes canadensis]|uniref:nucleolar protein 12-like n=1 Tax=Polistes canadensis TaxID=91411 RepID=UPI000718B315|nr:PREDICTED: nucleolar protein 12-like [Polistes canadensis]
MTKVKSNGKGADQTLNKPSKVVKDNPIKKNKNKNNKFAKTVVSKVHLMDDKKTQSNQNNMNQSNNKQKQKKNSEVPVNNNNASQQKNKKKSNKQFVKDNKNLASKKTKSDESLDDTNEDITACDSSSSVSANDSNINIQDILGKSLGDNTDEDDTDFVEDEEPDEDEYEYNSDVDNSASLNKGVKMFKGIKNTDNDSTDEIEDDYESDEDLDDELEEDDDDDDDDEDEDENDVADDDDDDDDDDEDENDVADDDDDDDDEDDDEDDEEDEEDEEEEETGPGLKDLLASSIATDDDDDEDFKDDGQDDEDIDISDESDSEVVKKKVSSESKNDSRTIFISNIPKQVTKEEIRKLFKKFGEIESIRVRSVIPIDLKMSKKVAAIKKKIHPKVETIIMFIIYKLEEGAKKATSMNGKQLKGNYLKVDIVDKNSRIKPDEKKAVFLGNLPFTIQDNDLWEHFKPCGEIHSVRLIKNKKLGIGKGIGYVNFKNEDSVSLALELNGSTLLNREIRVQRCSVNDQKEKKLINKKKRSFPVVKKVKSNKKFKSSDSDGTTPTENDKKKLKTKNESQKNNSPNASKKVATSFQGQKAKVEKKKKMTSKLMKNYLKTYKN